MGSWHTWQVGYRASIPSSVPAYLPVGCPFWALGKKQNNFTLSHSLSRNNYIGKAEEIFFSKKFNSLEVSSCHCHQFLPSFRKEAFRAGNLLARDSSVLSHVKTRIILVAPQRCRDCYGCHQQEPTQIQMCASVFQNPRTAQDTDLLLQAVFEPQTGRQGYSQEEIMLITGRKHFKSGRGPNLEATSVSHRSSCYRAEECWGGSGHS
jgi:hypothetical protein